MFRCEISRQYVGAGKTGTILYSKPALDHQGMSWTAVLWDDEEDPDFFKTKGLIILEAEEQ